MNLALSERLLLKYWYIYKLYIELDSIALTAYVSFGSAMISAKNDVILFESFVLIICKSLTDSNLFEKLYVFKLES